MLITFRKLVHKIFYTPHQIEILKYIYLLLLFLDSEMLFYFIICIIQFCLFYRNVIKQKYFRDSMHASKSIYYNFIFVQIMPQKYMHEHLGDIDYHKPPSRTNKFYVANKVSQSIYSLKIQDVSLQFSLQSASIILFIAYPLGMDNYIKHS